jgi:porphobilinogen synthase
LRGTPALRALVAETHVHCHDLIYPLFVDARLRRPEEIPAMPGQYRWPVDMVAEQIACAQALGVGATLLFGLPERKDPYGSSSWEPDGVVQWAVAAINSSAPSSVRART